MRTPGRDEDLALGFLLGEGIVHGAGDVRAMVAVPAAGDDGVDELRIELAAAPAGLAKARLARTHEIRSSCGVCGMGDANVILEGTAPLLPGVPKVQASLVPELVRTLRARQELFSATGGCHGALLASADGAVTGFGEDVGRHNALDKAIGQAARAGADLPRSIAVLSGRAGYDLVIKCLRVRVPIVVSVSAPSSLAFDLCSSAGATLIGFAREGKYHVYCGAERLVDDDGSQPAR
jgi:FdhD protein